jgi:Zn-dependent protease
MGVVSTGAGGGTPPAKRSERPQRLRGPGIYVGKLAGIPVFVSPSWLVPAAFITILYADVFSPGLPPGAAPRPVAYLLSFGVAVLVALSVFVHEASHSLTARALGLPVRRIVIHLVGGVSEVGRDPETPTREYLIAAAGPLISLLLAGCGFAAIPFLHGHLARYAVVFGLVNGLVGVLNLLPGLPLDGGRLLHSALWRTMGDRHRASVAAANAGRVVAVAIALFPVVRQDVSGSAQPGQTGLDTDVVWGLLIAMYVWVGATVELRNAELRRRLPAVRVRELLRRALAVAYDLPLAEAVRRARESGARALVTVDAQGRPDGVVSEQAVMATPLERQPWMSVSQVARHLEPKLILHVESDGEALLETLRTSPASEYVVVDGTGEVLGVLATADVAAALDAPSRGRPPRPPGSTTPPAQPPLPRQGDPTG